MKKSLLTSLLSLIVIITSYSQELITLYGAVPMNFTSTGVGTFNKSVVYHGSSGFLIDLAKSTDNISGIPIDFKIDARGGGHNFLFVKGSTGNVGIGTVTPAYKLDVIGTVRAKEVKVDLSGADFVFEKDYGLMPLADLEAFIKANKHLPEIESASEMEADGVELGELNSKLLQKIEELTLYLLMQNKQIELLKNENKQLKELDSRLKMLEAQSK